MINYWKQPGIPRKAWSLIEVIDLVEEGEAEFETCMMCGNENIRYVHIVTHKKVEEEFRVGCVCAENMTNDYVNPKKREKDLRNRASRRINWQRKEWRLSMKGNLFINYDRHHLLIYTDEKTEKYRLKIDNIFGKKTFDTIEQAKMAAFKGVEYLKEKGMW